jgi:outer membrane protein OmpA-like peptidoglycan-associated protein
MKPVLVAPLIATLALAGCTSMGPRQQAGTATGAVAGGLLGGLLGKSPGAAAVGAVAGGIAGSAIGQQLDKQAGDLRSSLSSDKIGVVNKGDRLVVTMPDDLLFATDSAALSPTLRTDLRALAANLVKYPNSTVRVVGHTDNTGTASHNKDLSQRRAKSVAQVLINNGVAPGRIVTIGRGEIVPVATNLTPEGRAQNRRVEIVIIPNG